MIKMRRNCFETNSSSTHSITLEEYYEPHNRTFQYTKIPLMTQNLMKMEII